MLKRLILSFTILFFVSAMVNCSSLTIRHMAFFDFSELVKYSDAICIIKINSISSAILGEKKAKFTCSRIIKGYIDNSFSHILYGTKYFSSRIDDTEFIEGANYLVFLGKSNGTFRLMNNQSSSYFIDENGSVLFEGKKIKIDDFINNISEKLMSTKEN